MIRLTCLLATSVLLFACGADPAPGEKCEPEGGAACQDEAVALECSEGTFRVVPCRGPGGCTVSESATICDFSQARVDDPCFASSEGRALCDVNTANQALKCEGGKFVAYPCPNGCSITQGNVFCQ